MLFKEEFREVSLHLEAKVSLPALNVSFHSIWWRNKEQLSFVFSTRARN